MFNYQNQSRTNFNRVNVTTLLYTSYSDQWQFRLYAWNTNQLSLRFYPVAGQTVDGLRNYAKDPSLTTGLSSDNTIALIEGIKKNIIESDNEDDVSISVTTGTGENKKFITVGRKEKKLYISVAVNLDADDKTTEDHILTHYFQPVKYIKGYNPTDGSGEAIEVESDFVNFYNKLNDIYKMSPTCTHQKKVNDAFYQMNKQGNKTFNNNNYGNTYNNNYDTTPAPANDTYGQVANIDSLSDFLNGE